MAGKAFVFYGENEYSIAEAVEEVKASLGPREMVEPNTSVLDGRQASLAELRLTCGAAPFLAEHRLVLVEGLLDRFESARRRRGRPKAADEPTPDLGEWAGLPGSIGSMPPTTTLVMTGGGVDQQNGLLRLLRPVATCRYFPALRGPQLTEWVHERARKAHGRFSPGAARLLAELSGGDLRLLDQEIEKLCTYAGQEPVTEQTVRELVHSARETRIFELLDAAVQRRQQTAMRALEHLLVQGTPVPVVLTMLARQVRQMITAKVLTEQGAARPEIMAALGTTSDFVTDKTLEQARAYSLDELKMLMQRLLETDLAYKTGSLPEELAVELLVASQFQSWRTRL